MLKWNGGFGKHFSLFKGYLKRVKNTLKYLDFFIFITFRYCFVIFLYVDLQDIYQQIATLSVLRY